MHWASGLFKLLTLLVLSAAVNGQCPWSRELTDLHADCVCAYNSVQRLSIQCSPINFTRLMIALHTSVENLPIDLLYVNNCTTSNLTGEVFHNLDIRSLHISRCKIDHLGIEVFEGLGRNLVSLNFQENSLAQIPTESFSKLSALKELDLSHNLITSLPGSAFKGLRLTTLKLADNQLNISDGAFRGLEASLKNLNLKGVGLEKFPNALKNLGVLTYLDLAQNKIAEIPPGSLGELHSLSVLNLERNRILKIGSAAFEGVNDTLNSLSLLNNLILEFPSQALSILTEIRVLDLGFNGIRVIPGDAFQNNQYLALLALDGNPLATIPEQAFMQLNSTLRGLSIGGSYLECNCKLRWILEWMRHYDLQVTSRERNPQFCSKPEHLRRRVFSQLTLSDMTCDNETKTTKGPKRLDSVPETQLSVQEVPPKPTIEEVTFQTISVSSRGKTPVSSKPPSIVPSTQPRISSTPVPTTLHSTETIKMVDAQVKDSSIAVHWEADSTNILGFLVIYRAFGEPEFKRGPALDKNRRRFILENLPHSECLIICVITLEDASNLAANAVPYSQCREARTEANKLDAIVIAASATICAVVIIAVVTILCCYRRREKPMMSHQMPPPTTIPGPIKSDHEWETSSMYSTRSIPRARMYHMDGSVNQSFLVDDNRSHISHYSQVPNGYLKARSTADGQSHRSYSQFSNRFSNTLGHPEIRKSQQSLSQISGHHSFIGSNMTMPKKNGRLTSANSLHSLTEYNGGDWQENHKYRKGYGPR